jgi:hypothetical protein
VKTAGGKRAQIYQNSSRVKPNDWSNPSFLDVNWRYFLKIGCNSSRTSELTIKQKEQYYGQKYQSTQISWKP